MSLGTALKKINARAKALRKKHPGAKYSTLQKQAGKEYKAGRLKKRKPAKKKAAVKNKRPRLVTKTRVLYKVVRPKKRGKHHKAKVIVTHTKGVTGVRKRRRKRYVKTVTRRRRVGAAGGSMTLPVVALGAAGLLAYFLLKPSTQATGIGVNPYLAATGNPTRDNQAAEILAWATAAGVAGNIAINLINALNSKSATEVDQIHNAIQNGADPTSFVAGY